MADPLHHAQSSAKHYGGVAEDYLPIHQWFDESKAFIPGPAHRALRHHAEGIALMCKIFGASIVINGKAVPTRWIGEQHVLEDFGMIPTVQDFLQHLQIQPWMVKGARPLSREL